VDRIATTAALMKGAALEDRRLAKGQIIARGTADQRDLAQRILHRHGQQFLGMGQAIDQKQRDMVHMLAQSTALPLGLGGQAADLGTGGGGVEIVDVEEQCEDR
jgi:hypothetical protein